MARALNDLNEQEIARLVQKYGVPKKLSFTTEFLDFECELVKRSAAKGRHHDITCFIRHKEGFVVIQKHNYAETPIFRAPSGGANKGESLEIAAKREMYEETGFEIELRRFVLDVSLEVRCKDAVIPWRSLVFLADVIGGKMGAVDTHEIYAVRILSEEELLGEVERAMINSGWGGFKYRAFLCRSFFEELKRLECSEK